jgi:hypothetical protein
LPEAVQAERVKLNLDIIDAAIRDDGFPIFVEHIFSHSVDILKDGKFTSGPFVMDIAQWLGSNKKTLRVSARDHFKTMSFYAHIMWKIFRLFYIEKNREINYFSYGEGMASYHLAKIKVAIKCNPYFEGIIDLKAQADSILSYSWDGKKKITVNPRGLLEFKRGIHCHDVYVDDPFQDPENKMIPTKILKINDAMKSQILDMFQEECHIAGTAQTNHDFFFDDAFVSRFSRRILPAVVDEANKIALWPEWMNFDELMSKKRERGEKVFNQEYLCSPVYAEDAFVNSKDRLYSVVNPALKNHTVTSWMQEIERRIAKKEDTDFDRVAGWDLGKKGHPAHFVVFERRGKKRIQIHDRWFEHIDYTDQLKYIREFVEAMGIYRVFYDATRGELEMLEETGELGGEFEGIHFTFKGKHKMAGAFDRSITNKEIELLNIPRSLNQILNVNNELQAPTTPEGHGDSFWSIALTHMDQEDEGTDIHFA